MVSANDLFKDEMQLSLDTLNRKVTVHLRNKTEVYFSDIGQMLLGFSPNTVISITSTAERAVDLEHGFNNLYVYCDIIQSQYNMSETHSFPYFEENQQVIYSPAILTCQQKAILNHRSQYKARHRRICAIRVWESVTYTSFSTEQTRELLKR